MRRLIIVCCGGGLGSGARYLLTGLFASSSQGGMPWGTLLVNATGSFVIAVVMTLALEAGLVSPDLRLFLTTGVMGGYTTYSSFNFETVRMLTSGSVAMAALYAGLTLVGCLVAGVAGIAGARALASMGTEEEA